VKATNASVTSVLRKGWEDKKEEENNERKVTAAKRRLGKYLRTYQR
jgi:hypothetical protein